jgi:glycosyltransferase involved in cell wall biosynthesis
MGERWPVLIMVRSLGEGGCERDAAKLAIGLDRSRFEPHVAVFYDGGYRTPEVKAAGVPILSLPVRSFLNSTAWHGARKMGAYIRGHGIQLVHALDIPFTIYGAPVARFYRVPVIITSQLSFRDMYSPFHRATLRVTDWFSHCVVVNSRAVGDTLERQYHLRSDKLFLCYNGVNPDQFHPGPGILVPALKNASLIIGAVCVMRPEKRLDWILKAFAQLHPLHPGARLLLVGSGSETAALIELRDRLGLRDVCHFEPGQSDVADWMRTIDVFVASSVSESFPNALLEAMACGVPVIASAATSLVEVVGDAGVTVTAGSQEALEMALRRVLGSSPLHADLAARGLARAAEFTWERTASGTLSVYRRVLAETAS